ncbi:hypothetical protein N0V90_005565 [Kalmusia sp. IMI 367209]|nr:hypothetical protein N0V90_005565 [Kalmusia sp. IMI 367209]
MTATLEIPDEKRGSSPDSRIEDSSRQRHGSTSPPANRASIAVSAAERARRHLNARLANPLQGYSYDELQKMGRAYAHDHELTEDDDVRAMEIGACLARDPANLKNVKRLGVTDEELVVLEQEISHRWAQPRLLYLVIILCSTCAAVQGMDETVVNGAQLFYADQFGIGGDEYRSTWLVGLVNSAPYTWWHMFIARFALGLGIGPKSATVPIYAAECTPPSIRGALVMQWQMWTAFGIMVGYAAGLAFYGVHDRHNITGLNWRLMMGSAMLPAVVVCCFVFMCPESPRWYMSKGRHASAYQAMCRLRFNKIQAARDIFYMAELLRAEENMKIGQSKIKELWTVPRNRRAMLASEIVMFMQQFCGVNVIAYYSSSIFSSSGFSDHSALAASLGFGVINFLFAIPAVYTIDTFGRRNLLLSTFPLMALFLLFTGFSFWIPDSTDARVACIALGIYLFGVVYSPGEGPVPFTYSAEAYPLYIRTLGMSLATATTWFFNALLSITWPSLLRAFKPQGAFGWYAAWNIIGWVLVLLFMPETKGKTLEELDQIFSVPTRVHAAYGLRQIPYFFNRYLLRRKVQPEQLYDAEEQTVAGLGETNLV